MKGYCECGHPSREVCEFHTVSSCTFKKLRKLRARKHTLTSGRKYTEKIREKDLLKMFSPEFELMIAVEQLYKILDDILDKEVEALNAPEGKCHHEYRKEKVISCCCNCQCNN